MNDKQAYLSCAAVARKLGLSRQRFWQLRKEGVFPQPQIDEETGRPFYTDEQVEVCLDLRKRNVGMNGKVILFYSVRSTTVMPKVKKKKAKSKTKSCCHQPIIDALKTLGLAGVTDTQIDSAILELFPTGREEVDQGELVRQIFLHLQRKNSSR